MSFEELLGKYAGDDRVRWWAVSGSPQRAEDLEEDDFCGAWNVTELWYNQ